jgi:hypothetical protein
MEAVFHRVFNPKSKIGCGSAGLWELQYRIPFSNATKFGISGGEMMPNRLGSGGSN